MSSLKPGFKFASAALILCGLIETGNARVVDKIIAVVDSGVVLASDVETRLQDLKARAESRGNPIRSTLIYVNKFLNDSF